MSRCRRGVIIRRHYSHHPESEEKPTMLYRLDSGTLRIAEGPPRSGLVQQYVWPELPRKMGRCPAAGPFIPPSSPNRRGLSILKCCRSSARTAQKWGVSDERLRPGKATTGCDPQTAESPNSFDLSFPQFARNWQSSSHRSHSAITPAVPQRPGRHLHQLARSPPPQRPYSKSERAPVETPTGSSMSSLQRTRG